jgi:beta-glucosidase-like glycosyl hydrolase
MHTSIIALLVVVAAVFSQTKNQQVNTWACSDDILYQQFLVNSAGHIKPIGVPNRCLHVNDDLHWTVNECSDGEQRQSFFYDSQTQSLRHRQKKDGNDLPELLCLTLSAYSTHKEQYGSVTQWTKCDGGDPTQKWNVTASSGHIASIGLSGLCLDYATSWSCDDKISLIGSLPMCDKSLTTEARAQDLASRLTPEEKITQLMNDAPAIPRMGIVAYNAGNEALHGVLTWDNTVTVFPQVITLGAAFNQDLYHSIGKAISDEARALANHNMIGLSYWAPNINIFRDPRWGRGQETPGEDPLLSSIYASNYIRGMQEGNDQYTKVVSTCKHFAAYSLEDWNGIQRYGYNAVVDDRDLEETYLPAFKSCVTEGKARSIMCSYNSVNGIPACANPILLQKKLRDEWGFDGYVVSDCDAVANVWDPHKFTNSTWMASTVSLKAGTDMDCGSFYANLNEAYRYGSVTVGDLDKAFVRIFKQRIELGMFNRKSNPWERIGLEVVNSDAHKALALQAAREGMVLLKNDNKVLPLNANKIKKLAVIGPNADSESVMCGNYRGRPEFTITALRGIQKQYNASNIIYAQGCDIQGNKTEGFSAAVDAATKADTVILVIGIDGDVEGEGLDRYDITLPGVQNYLVEDVLTAAAGKPVVVVLLNGGPLDIDHLKKDSRVHAILEGFYPGQSGGTAVSEVLFGKYNPGGLLPVTIYPQNYVQKSLFTDMSMRPFPGRTYRYLQIDPIYKFGYGLSYTTFEITPLNDELRFYRPVKSALKLSVRNTGNVDGDFVGIAYARHKDDDFASKDGALAAFGRVHVKAGQKAVLDLNFSDHSFERFRDGKMVTIGDSFALTIVGTQVSNVLKINVSVH